MNIKNLKKHLDHPLAYLGILCLAFLPFVYLLAGFYLDMRELDFVEESLVELQQREKRGERSQEKEEAFFAELNQADHFYIDKHLETLHFLDPQSKKEESRRLLFTEEKTRRSEFVVEVEEKQQQPVQMNGQDLKKLLSLIEGVPILPFTPAPGRPQLIIKNFELVKKSLGPQEEVFSVDMQLIKREGAKTP